MAAYSEPAVADGQDDVPELKASVWWAHADAHVSTKLSAMARRLPALLRTSLRLAWRASRLDTTIAIGANVMAGASTALGLLATRDVATAILTGGPTVARLRAALPSLLLLGVVSGVRAGHGNAAGWARRAWSRGCSTRRRSRCSS
jgi:hypothetical protein